MNSAVDTPFDSDNSTSSQSSNLNRESITRITAAIILLLAPVVFAAPIMLAGYSLMPRADINGILGLHLIIGRNIADGSLPFLNPYMLSAPLLLTTIYSGALYPPSWLFAVFSPTTSTDIFVITSYYIALVGLYLFGRRIGMTRLGAIISSAAFTFGVLGGLGAAGIGNSSNIASAAWIPWIMLAIECVAQKPGARWVLLGAAFLVLQVFAGDLQISLLTVLTALAYIFFRRKQNSQNNLFLTGVTIMLIGGALLSMIQLVPIKEKFKAGWTDHIVGELLPTSSMFPMRIPILAYLWLSAAFAVIISLRSRRGAKSPTIFWATVTAITLSIASMTPETLERTLYWIPIYGLFRSSAIPLFISGVTVAVLMGLAISRFSDSRDIATLRPVAAIILLSAIPMILAFSANLTDNRSAAEIYNHLQDPPVVQFIKSREKDLNSFRVLKYDLASDQQGKGLDVDQMQAIKPGLRYVNGARESAHPWIAAIVGDLTENGEITNGLFGPSNQGLDLLGIKYVLIENEPKQNTESANKDLLEIYGVGFLKDNLGLRLAPESRLDITLPATTASEIVFISTLGSSVDLTDGTTIGAVKLHTKDGRILTQKIQAGRDTSEWYYDRPDLMNKIRHKKARVAESFPDQGFSCHVYIGRLPFDRAEVTRIEVERSESGDFLVTRLSLYDDATQKSTPITREDILTHHLRKIDQLGNVTIYQNDNHRPAAWFVRRVVAQSSFEVINTVISGRLANNSKFDVSEIALLERENLRTQELNISPGDNAVDSTVTISSQSPNGMEMTTQNTQPGFLVLNIPYVRGWTAQIDGNPQPVERVNFALLGIAVPAGTHRVNITFNLPKASGKGISYFILGLLILSIAAVGFSLRHRSAVRLFPDFIHRIRSAGNRSLEWCKSFVDLISKYPRKIDLSKLPMIIGVAGLIIYGSMMIWRAGYGIGGSDSYGYASLGKLLSQMKATESVKELAEFNLSEDYINLFIPTSYFRGPKPGTMSNVYSMGLPLHAAAAAAIFGWDIGPFLVSPLTALLSVVLMYLIGLEFGLSRTLSAAGGALLGLFPTTVSQGLVLMSDVPAMLWSIAAVFAALRSRKNPHWAIAAGFAFGVAILIRPPNALLLLPILFALPISIKSLIRFGLGGLPTAALFFIYNMAAYGNPLEVGHSAIGQYGLFKFTLFMTHLSQFIYWISIQMSPAALFFWAGTAVNKSVHWRDRALIISWFGGFYLFWCFYDIQYDYEGSWWYTRYLLTALPAVILGFLLMIRYISNLFAASAESGGKIATGKVVATLLLFPVLLTSVSQVHRYSLYDAGLGVEDHKKAALWADTLIPRTSLVVSGYHSGAVLYYMNRSALGYDHMTPERWSVVKDRIKEKGYQLYALLMHDEANTARPRIPGKWTQMGAFNGHTTLWRIDPE
jgi:Bacterial membrane protein YfhO